MNHSPDWCFVNNYFDVGLIGWDEKYRHTASI